MKKSRMLWNGNELIFEDEPNVGVAGIAPDQSDELGQQIADRWNAAMGAPDTNIPLTGAERITKERHRQILDEGFTAEHDDKQQDNDLLVAARCYARSMLNGDSPVPDAWPWDLQ